MGKRQLKAYREIADRELKETKAAGAKLTSAKDRLKWLLGFVKVDLSTLLASERDSQSYYLRALIVEGWEHAYDAGPMQNGKLYELQQEIKAGIDGIMSNARTWNLPGPKSIALWRMSPPGSKQTRFQKLIFRGDWKDERLPILYGAMFTLIEGKDHLRACALCGTPFAATKRQEYCSTSCSQKKRDKNRPPKPK